MMIFIYTVQFSFIIRRVKIFLTSFYFPLSQRFNIFLFTFYLQVVSEYFFDSDSDSDAETEETVRNRDYVS